MAGFEEEVTRAYFEANGFLVRSAGLPPEAGKKRAGPLPTLAVFNPEASENAPEVGPPSLHIGYRPHPGRPRFRARLGNGRVRGQPDR